MERNLSNLVTVDKFEVADGYMLLEDFEFPTTPTSNDTTYMKHFKLGRSLKNTSYYTVRKYCALTPFGPFLSPEALQDALKEIRDLLESSRVYNDMARDLGLDLRCRINFVYLESDGKQEIFRRRLRTFTIEKLKEMRADLVAGKLNQLTHRASPFANLDQYCKGPFVSVLRAMYQSTKEQAAQVRKYLTGGASPEEAGAKVDTRAIDLAIDYFESAA